MCILSRIFPKTFKNTYRQDRQAPVDCKNVECHKNKVGLREECFEKCLIFSIARISISNWNDFRIMWLPCCWSYVFPPHHPLFPSHVLHSNIYRDEVNKNFRRFIRDEKKALEKVQEVKLNYHFDETMKFYECRFAFVYGCNFASKKSANLPMFSLRSENIF